MRAKAWHLLALIGVLYACAKPKKQLGPVGAGDPNPSPSEPLEPVRDLYVFAHDARLVPIALRAARRIEAASGVKVHVNAYGTVNSGVALFGSDFMCANGFEGRAGDGIAVARNCGLIQGFDEEEVIMHEMLHRLGVGHHVPPKRGMMSEGGGSPIAKLTADDLEALCAVQNCTVFNPEV